MAARNVVAVDLGAESGRVVLGRFDGTRVALEELHRFPTPPRPHDGHLRWDLRGIWAQVQTGLAAAGAAAGTVDAVGVDAWGVDYGLLGRDGEPLGDPVSYRDPRTAGMLAEAVGRVGRERLYLATGIQLLELNTVFQLMAEARAGTLARAERLLLIPDLFHRLLSGAAVAEYTAASTTGAYDMAGGRWATDLLDQLGVPTDLLPEVVDAGTDLGPVLPELPGYAAARVIAPPSHDTASAVVGVPLGDPGAAYVSSGTWSLVGVETREPVIDEAAMAANLTNEGGAYGTIRLLRNNTGMWLLQESRRQWAREGRDHSYDELVRLAAPLPRGASVVNADHPGFLAPGDLPARIRAYCARTGQPAPDGDPALVRCVLDSLAFGYRRTLDDLAAVTGRPVTAVHIVGGGSRNHLLNQAVADVTGLPVVAGPVEATALGNLCVQLIALGDLAGLAQAREVVRAGAGPEIQRFDPSATDRLADGYGRYRELVAADRLEVGVIPGTLAALGGGAEGRTAGLPNAFLLAAVLAALMWAYMRYSATGRHLYAIGNDAHAARLQGVRVTRRLVSVYVVTGVLVGLAAVVFIGGGGRIGQAVGTGFELQVIAAVVIGGTSILGGRGTVLGALLVGTVSAAVTLLGWPSELTALFIGVFILVAVGVDLLRQRRRRSL